MTPEAVTSLYFVLLACVVASAAAATLSAVALLLVRHATREFASRVGEAERLLRDRQEMVQRLADMRREERGVMLSPRRSS